MVRDEAGSRSGTCRGYRLLPHTADWCIEAWGPTRAACAEEAVLALVASFAEVSDVAVTQPVPVSLGPARDDDLLVLLLEEVIYVADALGVVPVTVALTAAADGKLVGVFHTAPVDSIETVGPVPKGVSHDACLRRHEGRWWCRAIIDV